MQTSTLWLIASAALILLTPTVLGVYDAIAYEVAGNDATISRLSQQVAWKFPPFQWALCFLLALLCGHLFTTRTEPRPLPDWISLLAFVAVPYVIVFWSMHHGVRCPSRLPLVQTSNAYPNGAIVAALTAGATVGSRILHQTG